MNFDGTIEASDILTSITIIISVIALIISWNKDRQTRIKEQANQVRSAAARTLAKLERLQLIYQSLYFELQPVYVEISELLEARFDITEARDKLWKIINIKKSEINQKILDEEIETAYVDLFAYHPAIRHSFINTINSLRDSALDHTTQLLLMTQDAILGFTDKKQGYASAMLGNALREAAAGVEQEAKDSTNKAIESICSELYSLISRGDQELIFIK